MKILFREIRKAFGGRSGKRKAIMGDVGKNKPSQRSGERGIPDAVKASVLFQSFLCPDGSSLNLTA